MKWVRFRIKTTTEAEDIIISDLYDIGLEGAQIEDNVPLSPLDKERMFVDILPETAEDDGTAFLNFFVEIDENGLLITGGEPEPGTMTIGAANISGDISRKTKEDVLSEIKEVLEDIGSYMDIGEGSVEVSETDDIDWKLCELIARIQYATQQHFFGVMAEKYFDDMNNDVQISGKRHQQKSVDGYNRLPEVFTKEDVMKCYGYNNENSVKTRIGRLKKDNQIEIITDGEDQGKYRKLQKMVM